MSPAAIVQESAIRMLDAKPGRQIAVCTDAHSYPARVLVAIARPNVACVLDIPANEYDGLALMALVGLSLPAAPRQSSEQLLKEKQACLKR